MKKQLEELYESIPERYVEVIASPENQTSPYWKDRIGQKAKLVEQEEDGGEGTFVSVWFPGDAIPIQGVLASRFREVC